MKALKKLTAVLLAAVLLCACFSAGAMADDTKACAVIGADLDDSQIASVYSAFGVERGSVTELTVTNSEERQYLEGKIDSSAIGTRSISCVYIELLEEGAGLDISCSNINWCTKEVYENVLTTVGITDAKVIIAAPFEVSGTAALTGIYKAYETMTGTTLDEDVKDAAVSELVITSELADAIGSVDAADIVSELKLILDETVNMTDEELREQILSIADEANVTLTEDEISQLISLVRQMEKMDNSELIARVEELQGFVKDVAAAGGKAQTFFEKLSDFGQSVVTFFQSIADFFKQLFGQN